MNAIRRTLERLETEGNMRVIPSGAPCRVDFSENDYLGIAADADLRRDFLRGLTEETFVPSSSASRLLASRQDAYTSLERYLTELYGKPALLFNSGYHANTGMVAALGGKGTLFLADKLVHASMIDGLTLSGSTFMRFLHNDMAHLERLIEKYAADHERVVILAESVYSMDGDRADLPALVRAKRLHPDTLLYIDEAHAVGVLGERGLGLAQEYVGDVDIMVGTFGKALGSEGAFALMNNDLRRFMVNRCRSLIFSTALAPVTVSWSEHVLRRVVEMDAERAHLQQLGCALGQVLGTGTDSHIQPYIVGDAHRVMALSHSLLEDGVKVLPIRTPTVPPHTERLRFSLSAAMSPDDISLLQSSMNKIVTL